jgi:DNA polymerase III, alpha subunit
MIYQEQLMKAAQELAGFTLAEADVLRKAIGKKIRRLLLEQRDKLIEGCLKRGIPKHVAEKFWELVEPFDRYGFNRSHAACYAMIAYETAYLKAHYPIEFMTAFLNAEAGDIERMAFIIAECKKMGIEVLAPDVNKSSSVFSPEKQNIRFGLSAIKNVGVGVVEGIIREREVGGPFTNLTSFLSRVKHKDLNKKSLEALTKCGALDSLGTERNQIFTNIDDVVKFASAAKKEGMSSQNGLFGAAFPTTDLKLKEVPLATPTERLGWEKELLGLYVTDHPLNRAKEKLNNVKPTLIKNVLLEQSGSKMYRIAGMITTVKPIITKTGKPMAFVKLEDESGSIEVVMFSESYATHKACLKEGNIVALVGRLNSRNGEWAIMCENMKEL